MEWPLQIGGKAGEPGEIQGNSRGGNHGLKPHMTPGPRIKPESHWRRSHYCTIPALPSHHPRATRVCNVNYDLPHSDRMLQPLSYDTRGVPSYILGSYIRSVLYIANIFTHTIVKNLASLLCNYASNIVTRWCHSF